MSEVWGSGGCGMRSYGTGAGWLGPKTVVKPYQSEALWYGLIGFAGFVIET